MAQNYQNHKKYYAPHHFIFLPLMGVLTGVGIYKSMYDMVHRLEWILFGLLSFCILYLAIMLRQHYALGNQDRIVRLEFRLRYFEMFGKKSDDIEQQLSFSQLAALRFVSDEEFENLLNRAINENLSADKIKRLIKNWQADNMRV